MRLIIRYFTTDDWLEQHEIAMDHEQSEYAKYDHGPWADNLEGYKGIAEWFAKNLRKNGGDRR